VVVVWSFLDGGRECALVVFLDDEEGKGITEVAEGWAGKYETVSDLGTCWSLALIGSACSNFAIWFIHDWSPVGTALVAYLAEYTTKTSVTASERADVMYAIWNLPFL
jgi:hypothetical protein